MNDHGVIPARLVDDRHYTLDDLIALNDEIVALVRSGVPLERGLLDMRGDLSGRLRRLTDALAKQLDQGQSLDEALASSQLGLPPVYGAIVRAGVRGGRLSAALEQLSTTARRIAEMRRIVVLAVMYPLVVIWVACGIFGFVGPAWAKGMQQAYQAQRVPLGWLAGWGLWIGEQFGPVAYWIPAIALGLVVVWWWTTGLARSAQPARSASLFRWMPGLTRLLRYSCSATFCEVLALLVDHRVPLDEALPLAGATSGDPRLEAAAQALAEQIHRGERISTSDKRVCRIPALVRWILAGKDNSGRTVLAIRAAADDYRDRAKHLVEWTQVWLPILLVLALGATVVTLFSLTVFGPWNDFITNVGQSIGRP